MSRDHLRSLALQGTPRKRAEFEYNGAKFEVLEPTVAQFTKIVKKSDTNIDTSIWAMIYLTVVPGTMENVFEETDYQTFMGQSLDGMMTAAKSAITEVMIKDSEGKATAASSEMGS